MLEYCNSAEVIADPPFDGRVQEMLATPGLTTTVGAAAGAEGTLAEVTGLVALEVVPVPMELMADTLKL